MAAISYLTGGESATAARMNALFGSLDAKLAKLLYGKSFILAWANSTEVPPALMGKAFFYTSGPTIYAQKVPGFVDLGGVPDPFTGVPGPSIVRPYDHAQFTAAAAAATVVAIDEATDLMTIGNIASPTYAGLPESPYVGFFEHSLGTHTRLGTGAGDLTGTLGKRYFLREQRIAVPEKFYDYALAEIIIEGPAAVSIPDDHDKYRYFRLHNLNKATAVVRFGQSYSVTLAPFQCATVKRTRALDAETGQIVFTGYQPGYNYFFPFEGAKDGRHFWFLPRYWEVQATFVGFVPTIDPLRKQWPVSNSMVANNVTNPAICYEWINQLESATTLANWKRNPHEVVSVTSESKAKFGDPNNPATLLGDLIHHRGRIAIAKTHNTQKLEAPYQNLAVTEFDSVDFGGYATIIPDFAAKGIRVREMPGGTLSVDLPATDPLWQWDLIPTGTNLFKFGVDSIVSMLLGIGNTPRTLESAMLDQQGTAPTLATTAPQSVFPRTITTAANRRTYFGGLADPPTTVEGAALRTLARVAPQAARKPLVALHRTTVADLLGLSHFGNSLLTTQDSAAAQFTNRSLTLTPEGLVLRYTESLPTAPLPVLPFSYYTDESGQKLELSGELAGGRFEVRRSIRFRGHGWGYSSAGYRTTLFFPPQYGRRIVRDYLTETKGPAGTDFRLQRLEAEETNVEVLTPVRTEHLINLGQTFWKLDGRAAGALQGKVDGLVQFDRNHQATAWYQQNRFVLNGAPRAITGHLLGVPLAADHYNAMAAAVNSIDRGSPLSYRALKWYLGSRPVSLEDASGAVNWTLPMPADTFKVVADGSELQQLCQAIGLPIRARSHFGPDYQTAREAYNRDQVIEFTIGATLTNVRNPGGFDNPDFRADILGTLEVTALPDLVDRDQGLAYTSPSASVNLRTAYENFRWISLSDARDVIESYGFKFVYHEVSEPLALEVLQKGTKLREIDALSRHTATMENVSVLRSRFEYVLPYQSVISLLEGIRTTTSIVGRNGGPPLVTTGPSPKQRTQRTAQQIVFRRTDNAPDALWKRKIWSGASHSSAAYGPQSVQHRKNRRNYIPEWLIAQARTITNYAPDPGIGLQQYGFTAEVQLNPPDQLAANAWPNLALYLDFEATNDRERDEYEKWAEWYLTEKTPLLGQVINSAGVATANHVYFSPDHLWSFAPDHWRSTAATLSWCQSSRQFDAAGADVARTPWVFNEATWTARKVALSAGNTILKAVDATTDAQQTASSMAGSRFVVLFDIANNFTDLT